MDAGYIYYEIFDVNKVHIYCNGKTVQSVQLLNDGSNEQMMVYFKLIRPSLSSWTNCMGHVYFLFSLCDCARICRDSIPKKLFWEVAVCYVDRVLSSNWSGGLRIRVSKNHLLRGPDKENLSLNFLWVLMKDGAMKVFYVKYVWYSKIIL